MRVLDLFAGTGSATAEFERRGHDVFRVELDPKFDADLHTDVLELDAMEVPYPVDFLWASPPCTSFSVGSFRHHWHAATSCLTCGAAMHRSSYERWFHAYEPSCRRVKPGLLTFEPKSDTGRLGRDLLLKTLGLIDELDPPYWIIENPRALMRRMPVLANNRYIERKTITHCQYGDPRRMKPTDLFGVFPPGFDARACTNGAPCHEAAPRGARTGTQGLNSKDAAMLPPGLSVELCDAMEAAMARQEVA